MNCSGENIWNRNAGGTRGVPGKIPEESGVSSEESTPSVGSNGKKVVGGCHRSIFDYEAFEKKESNCAPGWLVGLGGGVWGVGFGVV